jgi:drug/metabolite transporter (DMT)-like permease
MQSSNKFLLIAMILLAMTCIPLGDTAGKLMIQAGAEPHFVVWSRLLIGALVLLPMSRLSFSELPLILSWRLLLRAGLFLIPLSCILKALQTEDLANVFGAFFLGPIVAYFVAGVVLKERVTLLRSILLIIGFGGVLLVVKPGFGMTFGLMISVIGGVFYGIYMVANRWLAGHYRPRLILISTLLVGSVVMSPFGLTSVPELTTSMMSFILLSALASAAGNLMILEASRRLPAGIVAPFIYTQLLAATVFGFLVFGTLPDLISLIGLGVIISSGILAFFAAQKGF